MGIFSSNRDLQKEQFPNYELIDLSFDLTNLEELTSAQLAVRFSPLPSTTLRRVSTQTRSYRPSSFILVRQKI